MKPIKNSANKRIKIIRRININGLSGRMLSLRPSGAVKNKEFLIVYGLHQSIDEVLPLARQITHYGNVTVVDLPGFGGMQSFSKIKEKPTLDNLAAYLAAFIKLRYKNRRVSVIGLSYGFAVVTKSLQRFPVLTKNLDLLISIGGYSHKDDIALSLPNRLSIALTSRLLSFRSASFLMRNVMLRPSAIRVASLLAMATNPESLKLSAIEQEVKIKNNIARWRNHDLRTYSYNWREILKLNLCNVQIDKEVLHVNSPKPYFNQHAVEQHLRIAYTQAKIYNYSKSALHDIKIKTDNMPAALPYNLARKLSKKS